MADVRFGGSTGRNNFRLGDTQVDRVYLGEDRVWTNETTLTILLVDNTPTGASLNSSTTIVLTGVPGEQFPPILDRRVSRTTGFDLISATCTESGDTGSNVSCTQLGQQENVNVTFRIDGTYPESDTTVTLTFNAVVSEQLSNVLSLSFSPTDHRSIGGTSFQGTLSPNNYASTLTVTNNTGGSVLIRAYGRNVIIDGFATSQINGQSINAGDDGTIGGIIATVTDQGETQIATRNTVRPNLSTATGATFGGIGVIATASGYSGSVIAYVRSQSITG